MARQQQRAASTGYLLAGAAALAVLAFGGVEPWWFAPAQVAVITAAAMSFYASGLPRISRAAWLLPGLLLIIPVLQIVPLPASLISVLSAQRAGLDGALQNAGVMLPSLRTISIYPYTTIAASTRLACYLLIFLLALKNYQEWGSQPGLLKLLVALGVFEAAYGITQYLTGFQYIFLYRKAALATEATGTYINRNHYAGLLEMALPFLAARMLNDLSRLSDNGKGILRSLLLDVKSSRFIRDSVLFIIVLVGLIFSLSRAGIAAGLIGIAATGAAMVQRNRRSMLTLLLIMLAAVGYVLWIGLSPMLERFEGLFSNITDPQLRLAIWRDTISLIRDFPVFGTGLGTYPWANLHYQSSILEFRYEHAHNDLLETAAEIGIPLASLLWAGFGLLLIRLARRARSFPHSGDRVLSAGCFGAMTALLLHSLFDFNLQIPANALIFAWIAGTAAALTQPARQHTVERRDAAVTIHLVAADKSATQ